MVHWNSTTKHLRNGSPSKFTQHRRHRLPGACVRLHLTLSANATDTNNTTTASTAPTNTPSSSPPLPRPHSAFPTKQTPNWAYQSTLFWKHSSPSCYSASASCSLANLSSQFNGACGPATWSAAGTLGKCKKPVSRLETLTHSSRTGPDSGILGVRGRRLACGSRRARRLGVRDLIAMYCK